jgi:phenylalanyl-tRNA synthetase alpha subunit
MSDALFGIIREFEGALEGQMRRQREENIQRKREFEKRFLEKELELAERENAWKKELQRREVCHAQSQWACSNLHLHEWFSWFEKVQKQVAELVLSKLVCKCIAVLYSFDVFSRLQVCLQHVARL